MYSARYACTYVTCIHIRTYVHIHKYMYVFVCINMYSCYKSLLVCGGGLFIRDGECTHWTLTLTVLERCLNLQLLYPASDYD